MNYFLMESISFHLLNPLTAKENLFNKKNVFSTRFPTDSRYKVIQMLIMLFLVRDKFPLITYVTRIHVYKP